MGKGMMEDWHLFECFINEYTLGKSATLVLQSTHWLRRCTAERKWLMTNEEMQKTMSFIFEQQAHSSSQIDALVETQKRTDEGIRALLSIAEIHEREINTIGHQVSSLSQEIRSLGETTRATDKRLNSLISVVERQISEGRNGKP
jgi:hypothetical protein